jgi:hypothetical protein
MKQVALNKPSSSRSYQLNKTGQNKGFGGRGYTPSIEGGNISPSAPTPIPEFVQNSKQEKNEVAEILAKIKNLDKSSRRKILAHLALDSTKSTLEGKDRDLDMWSLSLYSALKAHEGSESIEGSGPLVLKRLIAASKSFEKVTDFMEASGLSKLKVVEIQSAYGLLATLLIKYAKKIATHSNLVVTSKFVINCSSNIAAVFEQAYPGYVANNLAIVVARQHAAGVDFSNYIDD